MKLRKLGVAEYRMATLIKLRNKWVVNRVEGGHLTDPQPAIEFIDEELHKLRLLYGPQKKPLSAGTPSDQSETSIHQYGTTGVRL